jgi:small-conductance mechanosensitive channel
MATPWLAAIGKTMNDLARDSPLPYVVGFLAILVMCYTLAWLMQRLDATTLVAGLRLGAIVAVGFIAATLALNYGFEARSITLWLINSAYVVVGLALAGAIIGGWKRAA